MEPAKLRVSLGVKCLASGGFDLMDHHYDAAVLRSINLLDVRRGAPGEPVDPFIELDTPHGPLFGVRRDPSTVTSEVDDYEDDDDETAWFF